MRFGYKGKAVPQGSVPTGITGTIPKFTPSFLWFIATDVYIGNQVVSFCFHGAIESWLEGLMQIGAHRSSQLTVLRGQQRHYVLIVGAIAHMIVYENIGIAFLKNGTERKRLFGI